MKRVHAAAIRHARFNANIVIVRDDLRGAFYCWSILHAVLRKQHPSQAHESHGSSSEIVHLFVAMLSEDQ